MQQGSLPITGERTLPGIAAENYWFRRHEAAYRLIEPWCHGALVLEAGCGEGYGAQLLERSAHRVIGLDYDAPTVAHVHSRYPSVAAVRANLVQLPVRSGAVDVVVSLQVIEHLWDQPAFVAEVRRVLRPAGTAVISTPNRLTFSPGRSAPLNPFHTRELSAAELAQLLSDAGLEPVRTLGVGHGRRLRRLDRRHGGSLVDAQLAGPAVTWAPPLRAAVAGVSADDFVVDDRDLDNCLDLLFLARAAPADH